MVDVLIKGTTPAFAGAGSGTTSYYAFGEAMVAMRTSATTTWTYLHGDYLGSSSLATDASGNVESQQRYKPGACPFASLRASSERQRRGEVRWSSGAGMPTNFTFTLRLRSALALSEAKGQAAGR